jgi:hypothetical protein
MGAEEREILEKRRHVRFDVAEIVNVIDRHTGGVIGRLVNISEEGLMLLGPEPVPAGRIFQLALHPEGHTGDGGYIQVGVESLWDNSSTDHAQYWNGFHIIDISDQDSMRIRGLVGV